LTASLSDSNEVCTRDEPGDVLGATLGSATDALGVLGALEAADRAQPDEPGPPLPHWLDTEPEAEPVAESVVESVVEPVAEPAVMPALTPDPDPRVLTAARRMAVRVGHADEHGP
jgi:hypothetical protein